MMNNLNQTENLEKKLSNLSTLSESHQIIKNSTKWNIPKSDIERGISTVGAYIESQWIYKESGKYFYLVFYPNGQNESSKGSASIKIIFYEEIPENVSIEGEISVKGTELNVSRKFHAKSFTKQHDIDLIETDYLRIHTAVNGLIVHCSVIHNVHYVECEFDGKKACRKEIEKSDDIFSCLLELSDITFKLPNNEKYKAVRALLVKVPYFRKLFDERDNVDEFDLEIDIEKHVFDKFIYYLYTDNLPLLDFHLAHELYALAHYFQFSVLKNLCSTYLSASLTTKNVLIVLKIAHKCGDISLKKECFKFIQESDPDILARESVF